MSETKVDASSRLSSKPHISFTAAFVLLLQVLAPNLSLVLAMTLAADFILDSCT